MTQTSDTPKAAPEASSRSPSGAPAELSPQERREMVAVAAYYLAEQRGFAPGEDVEDWLQAEQYIDDMVRGLARTGISRGGHEGVQLIPSDRAGLLREALQALGVKRFLLAIHDASFPSEPDEDIGRGAPGTAAAARLLAFVARFGFLLLTKTPIYSPNYHE